MTFYVPSYSAVTCSVFAFEVQDSGLFREMTSGCFPYSALSGSTLDTCTASVYGAFGMCNAGFAGDTAPLAVFLGWQAHDVQHHGRCGPEGQLCSGANGQTAKTVESPQLQFQVVGISFAAQRRSLMVQTVRRTMLFPQFVLGKVIVVPVVQVERDPLVPSWRRLSCSHGCTRCGFLRVGQLIIALMV